MLRESEPIIDGLLAEQPQNPGYLRQKMAAANYESNIYDSETGKSLGKSAQAVVAGRRYLALAQQLSSADPDNASARLSLAIACYKLSYPLGKIDPRESLQLAQRSLTMFDDSLSRAPNDRLLRSRRARALRHVAYALAAIAARPKPARRSRRRSRFSTSCWRRPPPTAASASRSSSPRKHWPRYSSRARISAGTRSRRPG